MNTTIEGLAYCAFSYFAYDKQASADDVKDFGIKNKPLSVSQLSFRSEAYLSQHVGAIKTSITQLPYRDMNIGEFQQSVVFVSQQHGNFLRSLSDRLVVPVNREGMLAMVDHMLDIALLSFVASSNDFFILHVCTGLLGIVHLAPRLNNAHLADTIRLISSGWMMMMWMVRNHVGSNNKFMQLLSQCTDTKQEHEVLLSINEAQSRNTQLEWNALLEEGNKMSEEHTIKLVYVCHYREQQGGRLKAL